MPGSLHVAQVALVARVALFVVAGACGAVRVSEREPRVDDATRTRIARLGCGDTTAAALVRVTRAPSDSLPVLRDARACTDALTWIARWMGETFAGWGPDAPRDRERVERFLLLRGGNRLRVYEWVRLPGTDTVAGRAWDIDMRRRGEGITGFSF